MCKVQEGNACNSDWELSQYDGRSRRTVIYRTNTKNITILNVQKINLEGEGVECQSGMREGGWAQVGWRRGVGVEEKSGWGGPGSVGYFAEEG